ncbi:MAG: ArsR/SmtB family transcription factor [Brevinema sp.]
MPKNIKFDPLINNIDRASEFCLVCSNPKRLLILCYLLKYNRLNVGELRTYIPMLSQSALSQHLAILRSANFVFVEKEGLQSFYSIIDPSIKKILGVFQEEYCK